MGDKLGGFQEGFGEFQNYALADPGKRFSQGLAELLKVIREARGPVALMCSERDVKKCHRRVIIDHIRKKMAGSKGLEVVFLE